MHGAVGTVIDHSIVYGWRYGNSQEVRDPKIYGLRSTDTRRTATCERSFW